MEDQKAPPESRVDGARGGTEPLLGLAEIRERLAVREPLVLPRTASQAGVAVVLRPSGRGPEALFIERARKDGDPWSGQMAFPGGRFESGDGDLRQTAERETKEEVGLSLDGARLIGRLDDQTGQRAGEGRQLRIAAFVYEAEADFGSETTLNHEVEAALWAPLPWFEDPGRVIDYRHPPYPGVSFAGVVIGDRERHVVWGLTLRFLSRFFARLNRAFPADR